MLTVRWTGDLTWEGLAGLLALCLSLYLVFRGWRERRRASVHFEVALVDNGDAKATYFVVTNLGPHEARELSAQYAISGKQYEPHWAGRNLFPVSVLAAGHSASAPFFHILGSDEGKEVVATVTWKDGRLRKQRLQTSLSMAPVPMAGNGRAAALGVFAEVSRMVQVGRRLY